MTPITIMPDSPGSPTTSYRAVTGKKQSSGQSAGQALDALNAQLSEEEAGTLVVVQHLRPDRFFTAAQQQRLEELMTKWRTPPVHRPHRVAASARNFKKLMALPEWRVSFWCMLHCTCQSPLRTQFQVTEKQSPRSSWTRAASRLFVCCVCFADRK